MKRILLIFLILLAGAALRFYNLDKYSLWYDEAYSVLQAEIPNEIVVEKDSTAPLYILFIHFWQRLTNSVFGLRLPSVLFGLASIFVAYLLGRSLFNEKVAFVSVFLLSISPLHVYYSQEARMYSLMTLLSLFSVYFLIKSLSCKRNLFFAGYIICNLLNIYCHHVGLFLWISQIVFLIVIHKNYKKQFKKKWYISNLIILLLFLPGIIYSLNWAKKFLDSPSDYFYYNFWAPIPTINSIFMTFKNFSVGYSISKIVYVPVTIIFIFLFLIGILSGKQKKSIFLCLICLFVPILSFFVISKSNSIYVDRYFIAGSVFYYYIVASGLVSINKKISLPICLIILVTSLFSLNNCYKNKLPYLLEERLWVQRKKDHKGIAEHISNGIKKEDAVYHTCRNTIFPFIYYFNKVRNIVETDNNKGAYLSFVDGDRLKLYEINLFGRFKDVSESLLNDIPKRIWLIFSIWDFDNIGAGSLEFKTVKFMNEKYKNISYKRFDGAIVCLYETRDN